MMLNCYVSYHILPYFQEVLIFQCTRPTCSVHACIYRLDEISQLAIKSTGLERYLKPLFAYKQCQHSATMCQWMPSEFHNRLVCYGLTQSAGSWWYILDNSTTHMCFYRLWNTAVVCYATFPQKILMKIHCFLQWTQVKSLH